MDKLVSVIIPNYNAEKYISDCLDSVLGQSYKAIEVIVIDDGSTDRSWEILEIYKDKDIRLSTVRQNNMNASVARNKGIELSKGEYLYFLDSDDTICNDTIYKMVSSFNHDEIDIVIGNYSMLHDDRSVRNVTITRTEEIGDKPLDLSLMPPNPSNKLFKRDIVIENDIWFGNVRIGQDLNFFIKYLLFCRKAKLINYTCYFWRQVESGMTLSKNMNLFDITEAFNDIKKFYKINKSQYLYDMYIASVEFNHYYVQMEKQKTYTSYRTKRHIVRYFIYHIDNINKKRSMNFSKVKKNFNIYKIKKIFKIIYCSSFYGSVYDLYKKQLK